ncbi:MAG: HAD-IIB family hydrolase [Acidobacteriota bacterium]
MRGDAPRWIVFTDLDGTLLDHDDYSWRAAAPAIERLRRLGVPLSLCSSKTRVEMESIRRDLDNHDPFVVENGAAIYGAGEGTEPELLAPPRLKWLETLHTIRQRRGFRFVGFADFTLDEIREHTGLGAAAARAAAQRDGTEPLLWLDEHHAPDDLARALAPHGLRLVQGGRFWHVMGKDVDKGYAVRRLAARYRGCAPRLRTVALGDSANDVGMLRAVDHPVVIPRPHGPALDPGPLPGLLRAPSPGPVGWRWAIDHLLDAFDSSDDTEA